MQRRCRSAERLLSVRSAAYGLTLAFAVTLFVSQRSALSDDAINPPISPEAAAYFESKVRPVLIDNCIGCHGPDAQLGGLRLDSRAAILKGGNSGPALIPGDPDKSLLIQSIRQVGKIKMPQGGKLKDADVAALADWVRGGALWPTVKGEVVSASGPKEYTLTPEQEKFWSLQPVHMPVLPKVKNAAWCQSPLDRFVLAKLEAKGLKPTAPASKRVLIRRVTFDLTGLPPTTDEVNAFIADKSPQAFAKVVDRLLASPRYGERWARHWLDVARYSDSKGYVFTEDRNYPYAYAYRDWVIDSFNKDLPYNQFVQMQLAADRLPFPKNGDKKQLAALGFLRVGRRFLNNNNDIIDDRIDVTMRGFQGFTVACARCHDHKFDPIPTKDYYSLYGVFASSKEVDEIIAPDAVATPYSAHEAKFQAARTEYEKIVRDQTVRLREMQKQNQTLPDPVKQGLQAVRENVLPEGKNLAKIETSFEKPAQDRLAVLRPEMEKLKSTYPPIPEKAMCVVDAEKPTDPVVFKRGNPGNRGDAVPRRFLLALSSKDAPRPEWKEGSGRLELAQSIASPKNPLTARVFVNRVWMQHFGAGIVRTPSDFGKQGERPTHPELLDYLASKFVENGWSIKKLQRMILLSSTYQQASDINPKGFAADPENRLLWRVNRRRLDMEQMRDSLFFASGNLDTRTVGGPSVELWTAPFSPRRAVYGRVERQNLPGTFRTFDFASPDATSPQRFQTTVPQQALFLMNSPLAVTQARALASRPEIIAKADVNTKIRQVYLLLFNRLPTTDEAKMASTYLQSPDAPMPLPEQKTALWSYGYGGYDPASKKVVNFKPLSHFGDNGYQASGEFPDPILRYLRLTVTGGHAGGREDQATIRRWTAPISGTVDVTGTLNHGSPEGDGIRGRIVSSRSGLIGEWVVHNGQAMTSATNIAVLKGDTLDFVVDCRSGDSFDSFTWSPTVKRTGAESKIWSAEAQFTGPSRMVADKPLTKWERYVQALLMTNEFYFID
jgi:mono/diheme cytochrome c family protein